MKKNLLSILILALLIAIIEMIIKHKNIRTYLRTQKLLRKYRRNKRATLSALTKLGNSDADDKTVAAGIQQLMRNYLSVRFEGQFANCGASEIMQNFYKVTNHLASEQKEEAVSMIASVFVRTDFIRYSNNSYGKNKSSFLKDEKNKVIENLKNYIQIIEAPEPVKKVDEENAEVKNV